MAEDVMEEIDLMSKGPSTIQPASHLNGTPIMDDSPASLVSPAKLGAAIAAESVDETTENEALDLAADISLFKDLMQQLDTLDPSDEEGKYDLGSGLEELFDRFQKRAKASIKAAQTEHNMSLELARLKDQLNELKSELQSKEAEKEQATKAIRKQLAKLEEDNGILVAQNQKLVGALNDLESRDKVHQAEKEALEARNAQLTDAVAANEQELKKIKADLRQRQEKLTLLQEEVEKYRQLLDDSQVRERKLATKLAQLKGGSGAAALGDDELSSPTKPTGGDTSGGLFARQSSATLISPLRVQRRDALLKELDAVREENKKLAADKQQLTTLAEERQQAIARLEADISQRYADLRGQAKLLEQLTQEKIELETRLKADNADLQTRLAAATQRTSELEAAHEAIRADLSALKDQLQTTTEELNKTREERDRVSSELTSTRSQLADVTSAKQQLDAMLGADLQAAREHSQKALQELVTANAQCEQLRLQLDDANKRLTDAEAARDTTQRQVAILSDEVASLKTSLASAESAKAAIEEERIQLQQETERIAAELTSLNDRYSSLAAAKEAVDTELQQIRSTAQSASAAESVISTLQQQLREAIEAREQLTRQLQQLEAACSSAHQAADAVRAELAAKEHERHLLSLQVASLEERLYKETEAHRTALGALQQEITGLRKQLSDAESRAANPVGFVPPRLMAQQSAPTGLVATPPKSADSLPLTSFGTAPTDRRFVIRDLDTGREYSMAEVQSLPIAVVPPPVATRAAPHGVPRTRSTTEEMRISPRRPVEPSRLPLLADLKEQAQALFTRRPKK